MGKRIFICFLAILFGIFNTSGQSKKTLVEIYRFADRHMPIGKPFYTLVEKRQYSSNNQLDYQIEYRGKLYADTTYYQYHLDTLIKISKHSDSPHKWIDNINYEYKDGKFDHLREDDPTKVLDNITVENYLEYLENENVFELKDSLNLLDKQLYELNLTGIRNKKTVRLKNGLIRTSFTLEYPYPYILLAYGVGVRTPLKKVYVYYTPSRLLVKEKFLYEQITITRKYAYNRNLIEYIKTSTYSNKNKMYWYEILHFVVK